jgi:copper resistance protein D
VHALYVISVWLHILAAMAWVGGMLFLVLVVVPWLRRGGGVDAGRFLHETGVRFRNVGWGCFALLLATGTFNLWFRGIRFTHFVDPAWLGTPYAKALIAKLVVFALIVAVSAVHDFSIGPRATRALRERPGAPEALTLRKRASLLGRLNAVLALVVVFVAVTLVRGWPF